MNIHQGEKRLDDTAKKDNLENRAKKDKQNTKTMTEKRGKNNPPGGGGNLRPKRWHDDINSVNAVIRTNPKYRASIKPGTSDNYLYWTLDVCPPSCRFYERFSAALLRFLLSFWPPLATILDPWLFQVRRSFDSVARNCFSLNVPFFLVRAVSRDLFDRLFDVRLLRWRDKISQQDSLR